MLGYAQRKALARDLFNLRWVRACAEEIPFRSGSFDVVNCCGALHNFTDLAGALAEVERVLRPGGRFTVATFRENAGRAFAAFRKRVNARAFTPASLETVLEEAGLGAFQCLHEGRSWLVAIAHKPNGSAGPLASERLP